MSPDPNERVERHAAHLAAVLRQLGVPADRPFLAVACPAHAHAHRVGVRVAELLAVPSRCIDAGEVDRLAAAGGLGGARFVLVCPEGATAWRRNHLSGRLIGNGPGMIWWRALELQATQDERVSAPKPPPPDAAPLAG